MGRAWKPWVSSKKYNSTLFLCPKSETYISVTKSRPCWSSGDTRRFGSPDRFHAPPTIYTRCMHEPPSTLTCCNAFPAYWITTFSRSISKMDRNPYQNWIVCTYTTFIPLHYLCLIQCPKIRSQTKRCKSAVCNKTMWLKGRSCVQLAVNPRNSPTGFWTSLQATTSP